MNLAFMVNGTYHEVEISESGDIAEELERLNNEVTAACGSEIPDSALPSRIYLAALNALVEQLDQVIGEVLAKPGHDGSESSSDWDDSDGEVFE